MTLQSGIARLIDQAPWKTPDQLVVERQTEALHDPAHGRTLPVFMGSVALDGIVFWRDGPRVVTETHTETTWETVYTYQARTRHPWHVGAWLSNNNTSERVATTTTTTTTTVLTSFAVAHSFNQFQRPGELLKVEFNDIVIYDAIEGIPATGVTMRVYDGIDNDFDPAMVAKDGAALTPAYHGLRYIFFEDFDLVMFDGAIPASIRILWSDAATGVGATTVAVSDKAEPVLESDDPPDWLIIRYIWSTGGNDFDTRTQMLDPRTGSEMGWSRAQDDLPYGSFSDDNTANDGVESCYFDLAKVREDFPDASEVDIVCKGFWYAARHTGDVSIELEIANGGTITQSGFSFEVSGATFTASTIEERNVTAEGSTDQDGELLFTVTVALGGAVAAGTVTLAEELTTFSKYDDDRGGLLTDSQVTTVGLAGITNGGVIIDADTDLRELSNRLAELYGVVKVETATGVKWVLKGKDGDYVPDVVLTEADLAEERRGDAVVKIATRHRNPKEIPAEVQVNYISSDSDYEPMPARAAWPQGVYDTALSLLKRSLPVPVVLTDQQALELAWGLLARARAADRIHSLKLRPNRLKIEPSDVFELTAGGQTITGMFTKQTKGPDHALEMVAEGYLSRAATTVVAESPIIHVHPTPSTETLHIFLDGPLLDFAHDSGGSYLVGYSVLTGPEGWAGGSVWRLRAGESEWTQVGTRAGSHPVVGTLTAPLPASPWPFETDTENELTFTVDYGSAAEIAAQTEEEFYEAASIIAVGAPGRWNFITFRDVTVDGDTITLGRLRQGLRGTEVHEGTPEVGDRIVLIKPNQPMEIGYDLADYDETVGIKAPAIGVPLGAVSAENFTVSGAADTPRAPGNLDAEIDGTDIDMTWDRRSRLEVPADGEFGDNDQAPLGADLDVYKVEILDGPGGTVVRTYADVAGEAKTYEAADITSDFGTMPDALTFRVSQKTSITGIGHGYVAERSIPLQ